MEQEWIFIDGSDISEHYPVRGSRYGFEQTIEKSDSGSTIKIHNAIDTNELPINSKIIGEISIQPSCRITTDLVGYANYLTANKEYNTKHIRVSSRN